MPDIAINVGPASGPLMTRPGDPISPSTSLAPIGPSTTGSDLPEPTAFYWLAGAPFNILDPLSCYSQSWLFALYAHTLQLHSGCMKKVAEYQQ